MTVSQKSALSLEELSGKGMSLLSRPFLFVSKQRLKILKVLDDEPVIKEHNGVPFITDDVLNPGRDVEKNLDSEFKNLVDLVLEER